MLLATAARAQPMQTWPMRGLVAGADTVVLAAPADPPAPTHFRALRVLLGADLKDGDTFDIDDLSSYELTVPAAPGAPERKPAKVSQVLLFFGPKRAGAAAPRPPLLPSGVRVEAGDGRVYFPEQRQNAGRYLLTPYRAGVVWDDLVRAAADQAREVTHLRFLKTMDDPRRRNAALLDWVGRHRREFGGGPSLEGGEEPTAGWGGLEWEVFDWVFRSRIPADCWAAMELYAELNEGQIPGWHTPAFCNRAGRDLLLGVAADPAALTGRRVRALEALSRIMTLWPGDFGGEPPVEPLDAAGQTALIDREVPLLKDASAAVRAAAAAALLELSAPHGDDLKPFHSQRALPALTEAYNKEAPGDVRDALAEAVCGVGGAKAWRDLTGNGHGVVTALKDPGCRQGADVFCWLTVRRADDAIHEAPTLLLERLDDKGKVAEKKEVQPALSMSVPQPDGWTTGQAPYFTFAMTDFTPGVWRLTAKGTAGRDKAPWASEPRLLRLAPPPATGQPNPNPAAPRITFDP
jgi:hypothetical protein